MSKKLEAANVAARNYTKNVQVPYPMVLQAFGKVKPDVMLVVAPVFAACLGVLPANADSNQISAEVPMLTAQQSKPKGGGRPPREALAACENKDAGTACRFETPDGQQITGSCRAPDAKAPTACAPAGKPRNG